MQMNIGEAKTRLSRLIAAARMGEDVVIAKDNVPMVRLVPVGRGKVIFGSLSHLAGTVPDFLEPMSEEELLDREGRD